MLQQVGGGRALLWIHLQRLVEEVLQLGAVLVGVFELRLAVGLNQVDGLQRRGRR